MNEPTDDDLTGRLRSGMDEATRRAPLVNPAWPGPSELPPAVRSTLPWGRPLAGVVLVMAVAIAATVALEASEGGSRVSVGPPTSGAGSSRHVAVDAPPGPVGSWSPGTGPKTSLGQLPAVRDDPVDRASLAVQVGRASRWVWAVAGARDRRLRSALDSSVVAPAALTADGGRLAVAFPGLVKVVDVRSGDVRDLPSPLAGGVARAVVWSPDGSTIGVLRSEGDPQQGQIGPAVVEVLGANGSVRRFTAAAVPSGIEWSPDGRRLLTTGTQFDGPAFGGASDGRAQIIDIGAGTATSLPAAPGALVGWYDDRTLLRSLAGQPGEGRPPSPPGVTTTSLPQPPGSPQGVILFLDLSGNVVRRLEITEGVLGQRGPTLDPTGRFGFLSPDSSGGNRPYAAIVDLGSGATVGTLTDPRAVPNVIGLGPGTVIVADELAGRFEVKAVDWLTGRSTPIAVLAFSDEGFIFVPGFQAAVPR